MKNIIVVSDTTAITHLARIGALDLVHHLYMTIYIPDAVYLELTSHGTCVPGAQEVINCIWIKRRSVINREQINFLRRTLDPGEAEAIALAQEINADLLIIDEKKGRLIAKSLGLDITGMIGILLLAKKRGHIPQVKYYLDKLLATNFKLGLGLYNQALEMAGELSQINKA